MAFDANWYLSQYPDVRNAGMDPYQHYLSYGQYEGRQPSANAAPGLDITPGPDWQRTAAELLGRQAPPVIARLSQVDPNYDWSPVIRNYVPILDARESDRGWEDPSRGSPSSIAAQLIYQAGNLDSGATKYATAVPALHQAANQENANILQQQNPSDDDGFLGLGDLGTLLALGGGIYGLGALGGLWGGAGAGAAGAGGLEAAGAFGGEAFGAAANAAGAFGGSVAPWTAGIGAAGSGGGMDWFDELIGGDSGLSDWWGTDYMGDFGFPDVASNPMMPAAVPESAAQLTEWGLQQTAPGVWEMPSMPGISMGATDWLKYGGQAISKLFGGDSSQNTLGGLGSLFGNSGNTGGLFSGLFGNNGVGSFLDKAAASAPVLAAIQYARNQSPLDTGKLEGLYGSYDPNALAFGYDQNTMAGRESLTSSLTNRGVMGSSFGNNDLTNFNTTRDLGRSALVNQGMGQRADIAKSIMDANFKSQQLKNNLYGSSLLALGNVFGGRSSPTLNFGGM